VVTALPHIIQVAVGRAGLVPRWVIVRPYTILVVRWFNGHCLYGKKRRMRTDLPSLPHLAGDSRILEPSPAHPPLH